MRTQLWSSGGGTQSAAIAALIVKGEFKVDRAVIVDTEREQSTTWEYHEKVIAPALATVGVTLERVKKSQFATVDLFGGKDKNSLLIPVFTNQSGEIGKLPTFCSNEWKQRVVRRWASSQGIKSADVWIGISTDEMHRAQKGTKKWASRHPLIERRMSRGDCTALVLSMGWPLPPRSSCWMCPNHLQEEWRDIKENKPDDWRKVVLFDKYIRTKDPNAYLHPDCVPIEQANLDDDNGVLFQHCDSGMCYV